MISIFINLSINFNSEQVENLKYFKKKIPSILWPYAKKYAPVYESQHRDTASQMLN